MKKVMIGVLALSLLPVGAVFAAQDQGSTTTTTTKKKGHHKHHKTKKSKKDKMGS